ncbi:MAG: hypothetical protein MUO50_18270, partial [Longimicrobiales bacterium]|nr:hypothetical protein [Longimicrobiales bacterium]
DILHRAYGRKVALVGGGIIVLAWCGVVAAQIVAGALLLGSVFSISFNGTLAVVTVVFVLYTLWGGQLSVIRTDSWQVFLFVGALLTTLFLVLRVGLQGGGLLAGVPAGHFDFPVSSGFGWYEVLVFYPLIVGMPYLVGPDIYSRILCARSEAAARSASLLAAMVVIPISVLLATLGLLIHSLLPGLSPEAALPSAISALAPVGVKGLVVVGVLAAIMSSADTTLISASTILSLNVVGPLLGVEGKGRLRLTRVFVVVLGCLAWGIATFQQGIIASLLLAYTVFVGGVALPTLASFWRDRLRVTATGAFWAVLLGGSTALLGELREGVFLLALIGEGGGRVLETLLGPQYGSILPLVVSALSLLGISWVRPRKTNGHSLAPSPH